MRIATRSQRAKNALRLCVRHARGLPTATDATDFFVVIVLPFACARVAGINNAKVAIPFSHVILMAVSGRATVLIAHDLPEVHTW